MYKVLMAFADGEHGTAWLPEKGGCFYNIGDTYPGEGLAPSKAHVDYLLGAGNNLKRPLIEAVSEPKKKEGGTGGARAKGKAAGEAKAPPEPDGRQ